MWERSSRHNPLSFRYQMYRDHRPVLPQDPTTDAFLPRHSNYNIYYYVVKLGGKKRYLCSNNIPVKDRTKLNNLVQFKQHFFKKTKYASLVPAAFLSALLFRKVNMPYKILYPISFYLIYKMSHILMNTKFEVFFAQNASYFYHKYAHMTVDNLEAVKDPRRQHFRVDTNVYYRQTAEEILHGSHHGHGGDHGGEEHHDTSTYYGPYPYNDFENLEDVKEIDRKFATGKSRFDNPEHEYLLGEKVDVNRVVPALPTVEDYRSI